MRTGNLNWQRVQKRRLLSSYIHNSQKYRRYANGRSHYGGTWRQGDIINYSAIMPVVITVAIHFGHDTKNIVGHVYEMFLARPATHKSLNKKRLAFANRTARSTCSVWQPSTSPFTQFTPRCEAKSDCVLASLQWAWNHARRHVVRMLNIKDEWAKMRTRYSTVIRLYFDRWNFISISYTGYNANCYSILSLQNGDKLSSIKWRHRHPMYS